MQDISPAVGNFDAALAGNFGPFLKWDPAVPPLAPAGYVADPAIAHKVVGGKNGYNAFSVTGGGLALETTDLTITGKIATNTGVRGDYAIVNDGYLDVFATSRGESLQVEGVTGAYATTPMEHDAGAERQYARIALNNGAFPTQVTVRNLGDKPVSSAVITLADVVVTQATYDGVALTVAAAATSPAGYPLTVVGVGTLSDDRPTDFPMSAPPTTVTVKSATGTPVSYPVRVTGGAASDPALPPVDPAPAGPPVNDNTPNNPNAPVVAPVATAAQVTPAVRGAAVTLDASPSVNASGFAWTQVSGPTVTLSGATTAQPSFVVPFFTGTTATAPSAPQAPLAFQLVVTSPQGTASQPATVTVPLSTDVLAVSTARHKLGTELRIDGTSLIDGAAGVRTPATTVIFWNVSNPAAAPVKLGSAPVDTLGAFPLRLKPGPSVQVSKVLVQSTRGGSLTVTLATK